MTDKQAAATFTPPTQCDMKQTCRDVARCVGHCAFKAPQPVSAAAMTTPRGQELSSFNCDVEAGCLRMEAGRWGGTSAGAMLKRAADLIDLMERHICELQEKLSPDDCACAYDEPDAVCMTHSPALRRAEARARELTDEVTLVKTQLGQALDSLNKEINESIRRGAMVNALVAAIRKRLNFDGPCGHAKDKPVSSCVTCNLRVALSANPPEIPDSSKATDGLCDDCPRVGHSTDKTRCLPCPRRTTPVSTVAPPLATTRLQDEAKVAANTLRIAAHMLPTTNGEAVRRAADLIERLHADARNAAIDECIQIIHEKEGERAQDILRRIRALTAKEA